MKARNAKQARQVACDHAQHLTQVETFRDKQGRIKATVHTCSYCGALLKREVTTYGV